MTWKTRLAAGLGGLCYHSGLHRRLLRDRAVVVVFHRVDDRYPDDPITLTQRRFRDFCRFLARHFEVIPFGNLVSLLEEGSSLRGQLAISFDDGYRDNLRVAAPILEELGLPACFFVTTGFIESTRVPWWDRERGIVSEWMTWDEVRELDRRGFEIGAHTITHADLGVVAGEEARGEIAGSKAELEARLGRPIGHFAYPFGRESQMTEANRDLVRDAGFRCCPSAFGGVVRSGDDPYRFRRFPVTGWYQSPYHFGLDVVRAAAASGPVALRESPG